ncbi:MAG: RIP metalloprotease RseP [Hydrogenophaga sp.]|uniref:RIP metalloprotease RseP n=1 Tax=Hydrogenophaga sp. TaxID=1904254 RepID=UPI002725C913|nr:RIP metalloprotease RseP [Hydrogenophaga sp.]MDO9567864.1 RIP metalloprotease RseP [Hydrogenophaga sp.]MDP3373874.1 RIP metalloprotease RseP [Hydrogenophaga sp.]
MLTLVAFVIALGLLIAVHEYGHYRVAVACGVKVLRFSIGFGKPLLSWRRKGSPTEFVLCALPLGGYVRMLDEREAPVDPAEKHLAFNTQPLRSRAAIVAAGPAANLLLAVALYALVNWTGVEEPKPVLASPGASSLAERAGLVGGEWVSEAAAADAEPTPVSSFEDLRWRLTQAALSGENMTLWVAGEEVGSVRPVTLALSALDVREADAGLFQRIGILGPWTAPVVGDVMDGGAAAAAGLRSGDVVQSVDGQPVSDGQRLRSLIRLAVDPAGQGIEQRWLVERNGQRLELLVKPIPEEQAGAWVGRVGAYIGAAPAMMTVRFGVLDGFTRGVVRTAEVSWLTLKMMGRMVIGEASIKNLSGPLTIADYAGKSASLGITSYLLFLALISVSLGVLNLLPLPVLDGGHLMYYLWEGVTGRSVSDVWMERLQRGGVAILMAMMAIALFNDVARLTG